MNSDRQVPASRFKAGVSLKHAFCPKTVQEQAELHRLFPCPACGKTTDFVAGDKGPRRRTGAVVYYRAALKCRCGFLSYMHVVVNDLPAENKHSDPPAKEAISAADAEGLLGDPAVEELLVHSAAAAHNQDWHAAAQAVQSAARRAPDNPAAWFNMGVLFATFGEQQKALKAYRHVLSLSDRFPSAWLNIALIYQSQKRWDEAVRYFDFFLERYPTHNQARDGRNQCLQMIEK